jgi:hypothetical protein
LMAYAYLIVYTTNIHRKVSDVLTNFGSRIRDAIKYESGAFAIRADVDKPLHTSNGRGAITLFRPNL